MIDIIASLTSGSHSARHTVTREVFKEHEAQLSVAEFEWE